MATITEDYVSFETAKLLKEKGFDEYTTMVYNQNRSFMPNGAIEDTYQTFYSAPTHQMAMKWLREVHNIHINVMYNDRYAYPYEFRVIKQHYASKSDMNRYTTYEECDEKAIKYCLENLI